MSEASSPVVSDPLPATGPASSPSAAPLRWGGAVLIAALAAWAALNYTPIQIATPEHLLGVDMYSPPELQQEAKVKDAELHWKNSLIEFAFMGLCFGAVPLLAAFGANLRRRVVPVAIGLVAGVLCGLLAAALGISLRQYLDDPTALSMLGDASREMAADILVYASVSIVLALPVAAAFLGRGAGPQGQKVAAIPLAGLLTGLLLPLLASFVFPTAQTNTFPPAGLGLTGLWLALLGGFLLALPLLTGARGETGQGKADVEATA